MASGYTCTHWLRSVGLWEVPVFGSRCELHGYDWSTWAQRRRRLSDTPGAGLGGARYGAHGRLLAHIAPTTAYRRLPTNSAVWEKNALVLYKKAGLNGQLRIIESNRCVPSVGTDFSNPGCFGAVWAYSPTAAGVADAVYWDVSYYSGGSRKWASAANLYPAAGADTARAKHAQADHVFYGKQRGVFGPYLVVNKDAYTMEWWGYKGASATD